MSKIARKFFEKYKSKSGGRLKNNGYQKSDGGPENDGRLRRVLSWIFLLGVSAALFMVFALTVIVVVLSIGLPDVRQFDKLAGTQSSVIYDREGGILYTLHGEENRKYVPLSEISPLLQNATVAIEDDQFFHHSGFDVSGIAAAVLHETLGIGSKRGGSTITQQLAKNAFLDTRRAYTRKLKELILAIRLERAYDKNKILELYLNRIPYGSNAYGAEMASRLYFGKPARELTLAESSVLASLPQLPTFYSPYGPNLHSKINTEIDEKTTRDSLSQGDYSIGLIGKGVTLPNGDTVFIPGRSNIVLRRMNELGLISQNEKLTAEEELQKLEFTKRRETIRAAHFVFEIRSQIETMLGKDVVAAGGLQVYTTLDPKLQSVAEEAVLTQITSGKETFGVSNAALLALNSNTGEILSMVGSADYFDEEAHGSVNHVYARRQPGSSFKPFIYAKAFLNRYAPATILYDTPTDFGAGYKPKNYDGNFNGPMTIRRALGQSRNIPAIKAYFLAGQQEEILPFVKEFGITSLKPEASYGPSLALGAGEVSLYEMASGFSVFSNGGKKVEPYAISKVTDHSQNILYDRANDPVSQTPPKEVLDPQVSYLISHILSDRSVNLGQRLNINGHTVAVKTGTSTKELGPGKIFPSNLWTLGYTPSLVVGVWAGNSDGKETKLAADGYNVAAPIWNTFFTAALKDTPDEKFTVPAGIATATVSNMSGKLASESTPAAAKISDIFASFSVPTEVDTSYRMIKVVKNDNLLPNEFTPEDQIEERAFVDHKDPIDTYFGWLEGVKRWVKTKRETESSFPDFPPTETTKIFTAETLKNKPTIVITTPGAYSILTEREFNIDIDVTAKNGVKRVQYFVGERSVPNVSKFKPPYKANLKFSKSSPAGTYTITAKITDDLGYETEAKVDVKYEPSTPPVPTSKDDEPSVPTDPNGDAAAIQ